MNLVLLCSFCHWSNKTQIYNILHSKIIIKYGNSNLLAPSGSETTQINEIYNHVKISL